MGARLANAAEHTISLFGREGLYGGSGRELPNSLAKKKGGSLSGLPCRNCRYFAAGGGGKLAVVWRVDNGEQVACFETSDTITSVAFFSASDEHERSSGGGADVRPEGLGIGGTNDTLLVCGTFDKRIYGFSLNAALMGETAAVQLFCHTFPGQVRRNGES